MIAALELERSLGNSLPYGFEKLSYGSDKLERISLCGPVVNLTLIDLPGSTKVAVVSLFLEWVEFQLMTNEPCEMRTTVLENGQTLNVIDTPGLFDCSTEIESTLKEIAKCMKMAHDALEIVRKEIECVVLSDPRNAALILRLHFHDCFVQVGEPHWHIPLGRKDSKTAGYELATSNLPGVNEGLLSMISNFMYQGLSVTDLVALSEQYAFKEQYAKAPEMLVEGWPVESL
ncbi:hypothetical protein AgCh_022956 [Apium graveolens]